MWPAVAIVVDGDSRPANSSLHPLQRATNRNAEAGRFRDGYRQVPVARRAHERGSDVVAMPVLCAAAGHAGQVSR